MLVHDVGGVGSRQFQPGVGRFRVDLVSGYRVYESVTVTVPVPTSCPSALTTSTVVE